MKTVAKLLAILTIGACALVFVLATLFISNIFATTTRMTEMSSGWLWVQSHIIALYAIIAVIATVIHFKVKDRTVVFQVLQSSVVFVGAIVLLALMSFNLWFFNTHSSYKKTEIDRLISIPLDDEVAVDIFGNTPNKLATRLRSQKDYVFEYEDGWSFGFKLRLESDGSVYLNEQLLYTDKGKVDSFMTRYANKGLFHTSSSALFFHEYLKHRKFLRVSGGELNNTPFHITLKIDDRVVFDQWLNMYGIPEAKIVEEMWSELRHFGEDGQELWGLPD